MLLLLLLSLLAVMRGMSALLPVCLRAWERPPQPCARVCFVDVTEDCMQDRGGVGIS